MLRWVSQRVAHRVCPQFPMIPRQPANERCTAKSCHTSLYQTRLYLTLHLSRGARHWLGWAATDAATTFLLAAHCRPHCGTYFYRALWCQLPAARYAGAAPWLSCRALRQLGWRCSDSPGALPTLGRQYRRRGDGVHVLYVGEVASPVVAACQWPRLALSRDGDNARIGKLLCSSVTYLAYVLYSRRTLKLHDRHSQNIHVF